MFKRKVPESPHQIKEEMPEESSSSDISEIVSKFDPIDKEAILEKLEKKVTRKKSPDESKLNMTVDLLDWQVDSIQKCIEDCKKEQEKLRYIKYLEAAKDMAIQEIQIRVETYQKREMEKHKNIIEKAELVRAKHIKRQKTKK